MKKISLILLLLLISSLAFGGLVLSQTSKPAELPNLALPKVNQQGGVLNLGDFSGGLNLKAFPTELKDNEAQVLNNAIWDKFGSLRRRKGWTHLTIPDTNASINGLFRYYKQDGSRYLLVGGDTALYRSKNDSTSFVKIKGAIPTGGQFYFVTYNDKIYGVNNKIMSFRWDGTNFDSIGYNIDSVKVLSGAYPGGYGADYCTTYVNIEVKDWDIDQMVGYIACYENYCSYINENTASTIKLYQWIPVPLNAYIHIHALYYNNPAIDTGIVSDHQTSLCSMPVTDTSKNWTPHKFAGNMYLCRFISGKDKNLEFFIDDNNTGTLSVNWIYPFDESVTIGDTFEIYRKSFFPYLKYISIYHNRLILASDSVNRNVVYYSQLSEPSNFSNTNLFTTFTPDGDNITGLATLYNDQVGQRSSSDDKFLIFNQNNLMGCDDSWTPYVIATGVGAIAPRSIVNCEGQFVGFAHTTGFYGTDGNKVTKLSEKIQPFWDNISKTHIDKIACGYNSEIRSIFCSVPYGSATENDTGLIYNIDNQSWSTASLKASIFANQWGLQDTVKFIWGRPDTGWVCKYGLSNLDNGVDSITLSYKSKEFDLGDLSQRKTFRNLLISYEVGDSIPMTLNFYKDFGTSSTWSTTITDSGKDVSGINISPLIHGKVLSWGLSSKDPDITIGNIQIKFNLIGGL